MPSARSMCAPAAWAFHGKFCTPNTANVAPLSWRFTANARSSARPCRRLSTRCTEMPSDSSMSRADQRQKSGSSYSGRHQNTTGSLRSTNACGWLFHTSVGYAGIDSGRMPSMSAGSERTTRSQCCGFSTTMVGARVATSAMSAATRARSTDGVPALAWIGWSRAFGRTRCFAGSTARWRRVVQALMARSSGRRWNHAPSGARSATDVHLMAWSLVPATWRGVRRCRPPPGGWSTALG